MLRYSPLALALLTACANASAVTYDPQKDQHCHALGRYFTRSAIKTISQQGKTDMETVSTIVVGEWFREKWNASTSSQAREGEVKALYEGIGKDFEASKRAYAACTIRATKDPAFDGFARSLLTKMATDDDWWERLRR